MAIRTLTLLVVVLCAGAFAAESTDVKPPPELGKVAWLRNFDEAAKQAEKEKKPLLVLFQEVPG